MLLLRPHVQKLRAPSVYMAPRVPALVIMLVNKDTNVNLGNDREESVNQLYNQQ